MGERFRRKARRGAPDDELSDIVPHAEDVAPDVAVDDVVADAAQVGP